MTDIERIRELLPRITKGVWSFYKDKLRPDFPTVIRELHAKDGEVVKWGGFDGLERPKVELDANIEFIALCRNNIAALIEAIEKAPHGYRCTSNFSDLPNPEDCDCWKAEALGKRS